MYKARNILLVVLTMGAILMLSLIVGASFLQMRDYEKSYSYNEMLASIERIRAAIDSFFVSKVAVLKFISFNGGGADLLQKLTAMSSDIVGVGAVSESGAVNYELLYGSSAAISVDSEWLKKTNAHGYYVSDVFTLSSGIRVFLIGVKGTDFLVLKAKSLDEIIINDKYNVSIVNADFKVQAPSYAYEDNEVKRSLEHLPSVFPTSTVINVTGALHGYVRVDGSEWIINIIPKKGVHSISFVESTFFKIIVVASAMVLLTIGLIVWGFVINLREADKKTQEAVKKLLPFSRLSIIGRLANNIMNELNNPLEIINQKAGLINDMLMLPAADINKDKVVFLTQGILDNIKRGRTIIHRFLKFADTNTETIEFLAVDSVLKDVLVFFKDELAFRNIRVIRKFSTDVPTVNTNRCKVQQVFLNVINGAIKFLGKDGTMILYIHSVKGGVIMIEVICETTMDKKVRDASHYFDQQDEKEDDFDFYASQWIVKSIGVTMDYKLHDNNKAVFCVTIPVSTEEDNTYVKD
ncbi:MAG: hypothetical protein L3V56_10270 [Candidatus Magnetoovum sp. WYHC-5]|nr:hypothetical protein [Candidatus Magnetoovum sp. WYHC-5]